MSQNAPETSHKMQWCGYTAQVELELSEHQGMDQEKVEADCPSILTHVSVTLLDFLLIGVFLVIQIINKA